MRDTVRDLLHRDPVWAVYALADLCPAAYPACTWWQTGESLGLLYRGFSTPIFWADGPVDLPFDEPRLILQIREEMVPAIRERYSQVKLKPMIRMGLQGTPPDAKATRVTARQLSQLERLYNAPDGPEFFHAQMLEDGVFFGAWHEGELVAVAGTHVLSTEESAAAIGNVYTRPEHRGQGHASRLTAAVACELRRLGVRTIALSVASENTTARAVYQRLGFTDRCEFYEGFASL